MTEFAIIVAGGSGSRMQSKTPKQFLLLANKPVLMHTIEAFSRYSSNLSIILVLPKIEIKKWEELCIEYNFDHSITIVEGGISRFQSVKNGLDAIKTNDSLVAIHDGVRPLIKPEIISTSFRLARIHGCAVASAPLKESLRFADKNHTKSIDRTKYRLIQTPQTFQTELIKAAYRNYEDNIEFTDDASVAEKNGLKISLFEGSYENIKITTPEDLLVVEALMQHKK
ncbi:MAG: 2-C-methyl-D-erythritol 4-phosphate cytidylyltransferase [Cyclobacteriaceae bacterium]|nr:2-C-methyl-D-erythritol 4-phosphate cytidylyltransferase [Cyclobacteriaceae bacterium]